MPERPLTVEQKADRDEKIRDLWAKGLNRSQIAERLGLSRGTLASILQRLGLTSSSKSAS